MDDKNNNLLTHAKKLKKGDIEEQKKALALHMLTSNKIQHSTTEIGIFFGGFSKACEMIRSYLENKLDPPNNEYLRNLWEKGFIEYLTTYSDSLFNLYEDWKRHTEKYQLDKGRLFSLFEASFNRIYKEFQRR
ncbi:hypothetical protein ES703_36793 [subsurface metagenome]